MARNAPNHLVELVEPVARSLGCELWGLEYHASGRHRGTLRIYIDKPDGVNLSDCERVSRQVSSVLDVEDPIQGEYNLEVSSPGVDRPLFTLEQFAEYAGERVQVRLRTPFEGRRQFKGLLTGVEDDEVKVVVEDHEYLLPIEWIDKANVAPGFSDLSGKKGRGK
ncbi:ribosome maturation factor RimP [Gilvimarinus sp. F26214L]|uniref:ribosome maturation factor RimP n=1 Tax=Gilvimarinus sp. DZF01 TaxID=3461371 RepID=UPI0040454CC9